MVVGAAALNAVLMWALGLRASYAVLCHGWVRQKLVQFGGMGREMAQFAILANLRGTMASIMDDGDLLILGFLRTPAEVGYYKLAKSIVQIAAMPNLPLVSAIYPELSKATASREWDRFRTLVRRGSKVAALWIVPVSIGLVVLARPAISMLYGPSFLPAAPALAILLVGVVVDIVLFWGGTALLALGESRYLATVGFWAMVTKYVMAFLLVPAGGYLALAGTQSFVTIGRNSFVTARALTVLRKGETRTDG